MGLRAKLRANNRPCNILIGTLISLMTVAMCPLVVVLLLVSSIYSFVKLKRGKRIKF